MSELLRTIEEYRKIVDERVFSTKNTMVSDSKRKYWNSSRKKFPLKRITPSELSLSIDNIRKGVIKQSDDNWLYLSHLERIRINNLKNNDNGGQKSV